MLSSPWLDEIRSALWQVVEFWISQQEVRWAMMLYVISFYFSSIINRPVCGVNLGLEALLRLFVLDYDLYFHGFQWMSTGDQQLVLLLRDEWSKTWAKVPENRWGQMNLFGATPSIENKMDMALQIKSTPTTLRLPSVPILDLQISIVWLALDL